MAVPDFLRFDPAPVRARKDGWTAAAQRHFILLLSQGAGPSEAARRLGRSKQSAYALRGKADAQGFANAWDCAVDFAATARAARRSETPILTESGIDVILTPALLSRTLHRLRPARGSRPGAAHADPARQDRRARRSLRPRPGGLLRGAGRVRADAGRGT